MNKLLQVKWCIALALTLQIGCNNVERSIGDHVDDGTKGSLSFVLPIGKKNTVTFASVTGLDSEYELSKLFIFWFKQDGNEYKLYETYSYGVGADNITLLPPTSTAAQNSTVATIIIGDDKTPSRFYIVANVNGLPDRFVQAPVLASLQDGATSTEFEQIVAEMIVNANGDMTPLVTPLPMSIRADGETANGYVYVQNPSAQSVINNVHLKRRVARFDIVNNKDYSNFEVSRIIISKAPKAGWLHDRPFYTSDPNTASTGRMIINATNANGTPSSKRDDNGDGIYDDFQLPTSNPNYRDSLELNQAVFYIWPTLLKKNDLQEQIEGTEIMIEGRLNGGITRLYKLNLITDQLIDANKVYNINIIRVTNTELRFIVSTDSWDETVDLPTTDAVVIK